MYLVDVGLLRGKGKGFLDFSADVAKKGGCNEVLNDFVFVSGFPVSCGKVSIA